MRLERIGIQKFRNIGDRGVEIDFTRQITVALGPNNAGKSNVLAATRLALDLGAGVGRNPSALNQYRRQPLHPPTFTLFFRGDKKIDGIVNSSGSETFWFKFQNGGTGGARVISDYWLMAEKNLHRLRELTHNVFNREFSYATPSEFHRFFATQALALFDKNFGSCIPPHYMIPEFRQIRNGEYTDDGAGLIALLDKYQHPDIGKDLDREKFDKIQDCVRQLLHDSDATLEVSSTDKTLIINADGIRLPLSSKGTGVHQLVIMLTAVLSHENSVICIEEPEIHLHPRLQREFISFIAKNTLNSYLISSHSHALIDLIGEVEILPIRFENGDAWGRPVEDDTHVLAALHDLGVQASDLLQSNCIIWVEGPSDRVYLRRWISLLRPSLLEGVHYSIMYYGGSLLAHASIDREYAVEELAKLLRINQHAAVIMDSDKSSPKSQVAAYKRRIVTECSATGSTSWLTKRREIENYIPPAVIASGLASLQRPALSVVLGEYEVFEDHIDQELKAQGAKPIFYGRKKAQLSRVFADAFTRNDITPQLHRELIPIIERIEEWNA